VDPAPPDPLALYLRDNDVACPACGYNLRGLTGAACPECNNQLTLGVNLARPRTGLLLWAIVPASTVGGVSLVFSMFVWIVLLSGANLAGEGLFWFAVYPHIAFVLLLPPSIHLMTRPGQRWFSKCPRERAEKHAALLAATAAGIFAVWAAWFIAELAS